MAGIDIAVVSGGSKSSYEKYLKYKQQLKEEAFSDSEKRTIKLVANIVVHKDIRAGSCPTCGHCLIWGELECDECYQLVRWY